MIIGFTGRAGAGKDTCAQIAYNWFEDKGCRVKRQGYADLLKLSFARIFMPDCNRAQALLFCDRLKQPGQHLTWREFTVTGREALQHYGTEGHREVFGDGFWIDHCLKAYEECDVLLVPDCRFDNEASEIRDRGGIVIEVVRRHQGVIQESQHASEVQLPDELVDYRIHNRSTLEKLKTETVNLLNAVGFLF